MRDIKAQDITSSVADLCQQANFELGDDVLQALKQARKVEESPIARDALDKLIENAAIAREERLPLCQDCGTAVVFLEIGQEVHITGGGLNAAVAEGVRQGYTKGYLRKSIVNRPFSDRINTGDNTPPVIHTSILYHIQPDSSYYNKDNPAKNHQLVRFDIRTGSRTPVCCKHPGRVPEDIGFSAPGASVPIDHGQFSAGNVLGPFCGIADGGRTGDYLRCRTVMLA